MSSQDPVFFTALSNAALAHGPAVVNAGDCTTPLNFSFIYGPEEDELTVSSSFRFDNNAYCFRMSRLRVHSIRLAGVVEADYDDHRYTSDVQDSDLLLFLYAQWIKEHLLASHVPQKPLVVVEGFREVFFPLKD